MSTWATVGPSAVILILIVINSVKSVIFCPETVADKTDDPIALNVVFSDSVWLILIGNNVLSA